MNAPLARRIGPGSAVMIGLGSMIGAGLFSAFPPAAAAAGSWLLLGLVLAGLVAWCNASAMARLAVRFPRSGGAYEYGRETLGPWPGYLAGWCFLIGKTASCAAMALTLGSYLAVDGRPLALAAIGAVTALGAFGITRTAQAAVVIVSLVIVGLLLVAAAGVSDFALPRLGEGPSPGPYAILQSAALLFFAFAGYARVATLAEEVRDPRWLPRVLLGTLSIVLVLYAFFALLLLGVLGPGRLAASARPFAELVPAGGWLAVVLTATAAFAALGSLLALTAGVARTALAMARRGDLPKALDRVEPRFQVPLRAEILLALCAGALVYAVDLREVIGFSSFGVLLYYFIANLAAARLDGPRTWWQRLAPTLGAAGCLLLALAVPWQSLVLGAAVLAVGVGLRLLRRSSR